MFQGNECLRAAFHAVEGPAFVFAVAATETYCGGCPRDLGPNAAGRDVAAFCWGCVAPGCCRHMLTSAWALPDDLACIRATVITP